MEEKKEKTKVCSVVSSLLKRVFFQVWIFFFFFAFCLSVNQRKWLVRNYLTHPQLAQSHWVLHCHSDPLCHHLSPALTLSLKGSRRRAVTMWPLSAFILAAGFSCACPAHPYACKSTSGKGDTLLPQLHGFNFALSFAQAVPHKSCSKPQDPSPSPKAKQC